MKRLVLSCLLVLSPSARPAEPLAAVLAKLDTSAATFRGATAKLTRIRHTAIINDDSQEHGTFRMLRSGRQVTVLIEFGEPDPKTYFFRDRKGEIYYPKLALVQEYDLGKYRTLVDQFLLLGFGSSGKDLARGYTIQIAGEEKVGGAAAVHLQLTPKSAEVAEKLKLAELWISPDGASTLQQKFLERSGDYTLVRYADLKLNPDIPADSLRLNLPPGVKRESPMK